MNTETPKNPILFAFLALLFVAMVFQYARITALPIGLMRADTGFLFLPYVLLLALVIPVIMILLCSLFPVLLLIELHHCSKVFSMNQHVSIRPLRLKGADLHNKAIKVRKSFVVMRC